MSLKVIVYFILCKIDFFLLFYGRKETKAYVVY